MVVGMVVRLNAGGGTQEDVTVLTIPSATQFTIAGPGLTNNHSASETVRSRAFDGTFPIGRADVSYAIDSTEIAAPLVTGNDIVCLMVRIRAEAITGTGQSVKITLRGGTTPVSLTTTDMDQWVTLSVTQLIPPGNALSFQVSIDNPGSAPIPAGGHVRVDAWNLLVASVAPLDYVEFASSNRLLQAGNDKHYQVHNAPRSFAARIVDLFGLDSRRWPHEEILIDAEAILAERVTGTLARGLRVESVDVYVGAPGASTVTLDTVRATFTERIADASVPVPVVNVQVVEVAGMPTVTTTVTTEAARMRLNFSDLGATTPRIRIT
jgi:hypothetical protein